MLTADDNARLGNALAALIRAKRERGVDWMIHSSWCSDELVLIALVRRREDRVRLHALGTPHVGEPVEVLEWAAAEAGR